jgi:hypothetical protein
VVTAVPGQERDPAAGHLADEHGLARLTERGRDLNLFAVGEELIEAGSPDDGDVRDGAHLGQATFSPDEPDDLGDEELEDDEDDEPPLSPLDLSPPDLSPPAADADFSDFSDFSDFPLPFDSDDEDESGLDPSPDEDDPDAGPAPFLLSVR